MLIKIFGRVFSLSFYLLYGTVLMFIVKRKKKVSLYYYVNISNIGVLGNFFLLAKNL